jgi:16S rRNA (uracil1498-N3)-methyltransferase
LRRLFAPQLPAAAGELILPEESRRHAQVLRLAPGDELRLFDGAGGEADARVLRCDKRALVCEVGARQQLTAAAQRLTLVVCLPKAAKLELIVRMATELGVHAIRLAESERAVPKLSAESPKLERLRRIALEAAAQSERAFAPLLEPPQPLAAVAAAAPSGSARLAFVERTAGAAGLPAHERWPDEVWAIVGPEGGLSASEVAVLEQHGYARVSLGRAILRVETACVAACALLLERMHVLR